MKKKLLYTCIIIVQNICFFSYACLFCSPYTIRDEIEKGAILFDNEDLSHEDLSGVDLWLAHLKHANLSYADLFCAHLNDADLSYADLNHAHLYFANLSNSNLKYADLSYADLTKADLSYADLKGCKLKNAILIDANFEGAKFDKKSVKGVNFVGAKGLSNKQKKFMRKNGAKNVPIDIVYGIEGDSGKVGHEAQKYGYFKALLMHFVVEPYKYYFKSKDAQTQT